jgi:hypothetical protein
METPEWTVPTEHQIVAKLASANRLRCPARADTVVKTVQRFVGRFVLKVNWTYSRECRWFAVGACESRRQLVDCSNKREVAACSNKEPMPRASTGVDHFGL